MTKSKFYRNFCTPTKYLLIGKAFVALFIVIIPIKTSYCNSKSKLDTTLSGKFESLQSKINAINSTNELKYAEHLFNEFYFDVKASNNRELMVQLYSEKLSFYKRIKARPLEIKTHISFVKEYCPIGYNTYCKECNYSIIKLTEALIKDDMLNEQINMVNRFFSSPCRFDKPLHFVAFTYHIGKQYIEQGKVDSAFLFFDHITQEMEEAKLSEDVYVHFYNTKGMMASKTGYYSVAISSFKKAIEIANQIDPRSSISGTKVMIPIIQGNLGNCYYKKGDLANAQHFLTLDSKGSFEANQFGSHVSAEIILSDIELKLGQKKKALTRLTNSYNRLLTNNSFKHWLKWSRTEAELLRKLAELHKAKKEYSKSVKYFDQYLLVADSIQRREKTENEAIRNAYVETILESSANDLETNSALWNAKLLSAEKDKEISNSRYKNILYSSLLIISALLFIVWRIVYGNRKQKEVEKLKLESFEQALKLSKLSNKSLDEANKRNKEKLDGLITEVLNKRNFSKNLVARIDAIDSLKASDKNNLKQFVINELEVKSPETDYFKHLPNNFIDKLKKRYPKLADGDIELCILVLLKYSNKQIAIKRNTTEGTVKSSKSRLKKKLQITDNLYNYLKHIEQESLSK